MKTCVFCSTQNAEANLECTGCGAKLTGNLIDSKMKCKSCGANIKDSDKLCPFCGTEFIVQEKPKREQAAASEFKRISVDPTLSSDKIEVHWSWTDYIFTAALNTCVFFIGCPKCGNETDPQLENSAFTCSKCGNIFSLNDGRRVTRPRFPLIPNLEITNKLQEKTNFQVTAYIEPDLSDKWSKNFDGVQSQTTIKIINEIDPKMKIEKITNNPIRANLHLDISSEGRIIWVDTQEIKILPNNQMIWNDEKGNEYLEIIRCFVTPNDYSIGEVIVNSKSHLKNLIGSIDFAGYQLEDTSMQQVNAIYSALKHNYLMSYNNNPPTFFNVGKSQTILLPRETIHNRAGNCIELAILFASCIERIGIDPIIFLTKGHAFPGYFINESGWTTGTWKRGVTKSFPQISDLINSRLLVPFEAAGIATLSFEEAISSIFNKELINPSTFRAVINLRYLRELENLNFSPLSTRT